MLMDTCNAMILLRKNCNIEIIILQLTYWQLFCCVMDHIHAPYRQPTISGFVLPD